MLDELDMILLLMIEILHDFRYQNHRSSGSIVYIASCRVSIITGTWAPEAE